MTTELVNSIKNGWDESVRFQMLSTEQQWKKITPEYLTTVHIAQNLNKSLAPCYSIKLEENTKETFDNCFEPGVISFDKASRNYNKLSRNLSEQYSKRPGKFDIVIYEKVACCESLFREIKTSHVIEVKNFVVNYSGVFQDIEKGAGSGLSLCLKHIYSSHGSQTTHTLSGRTLSRHPERERRTGRVPRRG